MCRLAIQYLNNNKCFDKTSISSTTLTCVFLEITLDLASETNESFRFVFGQLKSANSDMVYSDITIVFPLQ